jgi:hypothetical protein
MQIIYIMKKNVEVILIVLALFALVLLSSCSRKYGCYYSWTTPVVEEEMENIPSNNSLLPATHRSFSNCGID